MKAAIERDHVWQPHGSFRYVSSQKYSHVIFRPFPFARPQVEKAPLESYADVGGLEQQIKEIKEVRL